MLKETVEWCKPTRATKYSAMIDLYAKEEVVIGAGETKIVNLGVKIDKGNLKSYLEDYDDVQDFMLSHFIALHPRSSLRAKGLIVGVGICDLDFPDELGLIVHNPVNNNTLLEIYREYAHSNHKSFTIYKGDKIAQCTLIEHKGYLMDVESDVERSGGFGHSGDR
jgi:dUTPase